MTDTILLRQVFDDSGMTIVALAEKMGCSRGRIYSIFSGSECTASEIVKMSDALHMNQQQRDDIFLSKNVT